ncbi:MAG: redoxin domain-containing protein [Pirellulales bacterium]|nr:redoxin domain-containing protein [Pirellulales bacterium]
MDSYAAAQRSTRSRTLLAVLLAALIGCSKAPNAVKPRDDNNDAAAQGEQIAKKMLDAYRNAKSYTDHATYVQHSVYRGEGVERDLPFFHMSVAFERPNRLRLRFEEAVEGSAGRKGFDVASNGALMRTSAGELAGQVQESMAPPEITTENYLADPLVREVFRNRSLGDVFPQLAMLLNEDDATLVFPQDEAPRLLGKKSLRDRECYRIASTSPKGTRILWIDAKTYALLRMELPIESERSTLDAENQFSQLAVWIDFEDATFDAEIDDKSFKMEVADDVRRVRRFIAPPPPAPPENLGQTIADFEFETIDGAKVTPASLAGKTVLLDFWQVDCAPCKAHTPDLDAIYRELKGDDKFAFYAVSLDGVRVGKEAAEKTLHSWGGSMPVLFDPQQDAFKNLKVEGTPTLMLLDPKGRLQFFHIRQHREPKELAALIRKVIAGADLAAEARNEHRQLVRDFETELKSVTIKDSLLEIEVARPEVGERKLPEKFKTAEIWKTASEEIARPGNIVVLNDGKEQHFIVLDGGQAVVELDQGGAKKARHELTQGDDAAATAPAANGFLRTRGADDSRWYAVSGVGWQKVHVFDDAWKSVLTFPLERNPGVADVQLLTRGADKEPRLAIGYWGGVGVQGVGLDGKRRWTERTLDQVIQLTHVPPAADSKDAAELWCTSNRGTILVLDDSGKPLREFSVGLRSMMQIGTVRIDGVLRGCGLAVEDVGRYQAIGFAADGEPRWRFKLPDGEYSHQVERIQHVTLHGESAWMVAAADGTIFWLDLDGQLIDKFQYGSPLTGLSLTKSGDDAILLVSTTENLTAWKLTSPD